MDIRADAGGIQERQCADLELAWAAGFFDGEGCFGGQRYLSASIGQVNRTNLFRFQAAVGVGVVSRPYDKGNKPISFYRAYGDNAFKLSRRLWRFLGEEKQD